ncbi:MAG: TolC family protein [Bryobacterales bacterium]|nr:TolC family protein [Bryobacteraceae bacterium]MDW8352997.1 TolC family protein [Bryobacterales bacterium]
MWLGTGILCLLCVAVLHGQQKLTLREVVEEALRNNPELRVRRYDVSIAEARVLQARLRPNPRLSVDGTYLDLLGAGFDPQLSPAGPTEAVTGLSWELETAGKRRWRTLAASEAAAAARQAFLDARRLLVLEVQNAYLNLALARENVRTLQEILETFDGVVKVNETRYQAGDIARLELMRSQVAALGFRNQLRRAELKARQEAIQLQRLMGRPAPSPEFDVAGEIRREGPPGDLESLTAAALEARPDREALRRELRRAEAEVEFQQALARPNLDLGVAHHKQFVGSLPGQSLSLRLEVPLPLWNRNQGEIERALRERDQAAARLRALEQQIRSEVAWAWEQHQTARQLLESMEVEMIGQARRVRDIIEFSYRRGEASFLDLLDAQRTFWETMQAYNEARVEYARTLYLLDAIVAREAP